MGDIQLYPLDCNTILTALGHNKDFLFHLLSTKVLRASPSTSSAMISRGLRAVLANSRAGMMLWIEETFFSDSSTRASWNSHFAPANRHKKEIIKENLPECHMFLELLKLQPKLKLYSFF